jgi:hypothetical protein
MAADDDERDSLPQLRFSLRSLLLTVTGIALFLGLSWWISPLALVAVGVASLAVGAHVAGNAIGTRLRDAGSERGRQQRTILPATRRESLPHAPPTHLGQRWSLGWGMILPTATGAVLGMTGGCWWMRQVYGDGFDAAGLAIAAIAFGVLGGFAAFLVATFMQVTSIALWQALQGEREERR